MTLVIVTLITLTILLSLTPVVEVWAKQTMTQAVFAAERVTTLNRVIAPATDSYEYDLINNPCRFLLEMQESNDSMGYTYAKTLVKQTAKDLGTECPTQLAIVAGGLS